MTESLNTCTAHHNTASCRKLWILGAKGNLLIFPMVTWLYHLPLKQAPQAFCPTLIPYPSSLLAPCRTLTGQCVQSLIQMISAWQKSHGY